MEYKYFFGRNQISYNGRTISTSAVTEIDPIIEKNVTVTAELVTNNIEDLCKLFNIHTAEMVNTIFR